VPYHTMAVPDQEQGMTYQEVWDRGNALDLLHYYGIRAGIWIVLVRAIIFRCSLWIGLVRGHFHVTWIDRDEMNFSLRR
jgi:hypothetical protein